MYGTEIIIKLVVIEDHKLSRLGILSFLQTSSRIWVIGEAGTGEQGLEMVQEMKPDVAIVDLGLPGIDGIEVTRQIKRNGTGTKVVILTTHEVEDEVLAALSVGADAYCLKNTISERLTEIVETVHEGGAWLDPAIARKVVSLFAGQQTIPALDKFRPSSSLQNGDAKKSLGLTEREGKVLALIVDGKNNAEIAQTLYVSYHTVKSDVTNILQKLSVHDRVQAAVKALKDNLV